MVHLEEVEDRDLVREQPGPYEEDDDEADYTDTDSSLSFADDDFPPSLAPSESALDRIYALKDMIPPTTRRSIASTSSSIFNTYISLSSSPFLAPLSSSPPPPPSFLVPFHNAFADSTSASLKSTALFSGKGLYILSTGGLMVLVPYMMAMIEEQQIVEMEREQKARDMGSEIMSPGAQAGGMPGMAGGAKPAL